MFRDNPQPPRATRTEGFVPASSYSSGGLELQTQPTYTTVGSVYNPKQGTSIQPPTRRPRTRRYPQPIQIPTGGTFIPFPDALLSALPLPDEAPPSPSTTASLLQQYSPLQQNSERAANPGADRDTSTFDSYVMSSLSNQPGNLTSPAVFDSHGSVVTEDTLTSRITVKGLTNLASYPNPMQKAAQNTLARARAVDLSLSRPDTPSSSNSTTPDLSKARLFNTYGATRAPTGPPEPLKAGPPGHRPFKPTTLDVISRKSLAEDQIPAAMYRSRSPIAPAFNSDTNILAVLGQNNGDTPAYRPVRTPLDEGQHGASLRGRPGVTGLGRLTTPALFDKGAEADDGAPRKVYDTLPPERIKQYYPAGFPSTYDGRYQPVAEDWYTKYPTAEDGFTQTSFSERLAEINQNFYAGAGGLARNMEQILRDHNYRGLEKKVGVIGEERERLRSSHIGKLDADADVHRPFMRVEDVNKLDPADIAEPLLNMAFATLLSYRKNESGSLAQNPWANRFIEADDAWVDSTDEDTTSFFSKPRDEQLRKKIPKKPRRGY